MATVKAAMQDPVSAAPLTHKDGVNPFDNKGIQPRTSGSDAPGKSQGTDTNGTSYKSV